ncbi:MAG: CaiB/BaiF CoA transferase family protein [Candidatus Binatia bacterium]
MKSALPLSGIRVLDFSHILAGPFCTRLLADFGADVVKVETRTRQDRMGAVKPGERLKGRSDRPPAYLTTNRNKRSITINLKTDEGKNLALELAGKADVVVENFSAGVMDRLKLGYDHLKAVNPRIIYVAMSGYGHDGPRKDWTSMNMNLQAYTGLMMATGAEGDAPTAISNSWNDYIAGLHACFGILQAFSEREKTGLGVNLDLSQFECSVATFGALLLSSAVNGVPPPRLGSRSSHFAPQGVYRSAGKDDWCAISVQKSDEWRALVKAMGNPSWAARTEYETLVGRLKHHDAIDAGIETWTQTLPAAEVERGLKAAGVSAERMRRIPEVLADKNGESVFRPMNDPRDQGRLVTGLPFKFSKSPVADLSPAPGLGEQTGEVLKDWLGIDEKEIKRLEENGTLQ